MESFPAWFPTVVAIGGVLGTLVTAVATIFLWRVTSVLAVETQRMAMATSQPHVVATLDPNRWSMRHFDLKVDNTGNATAYDISVEFTPPLENGEGRSGGIEVPFAKISVLKPGQGVASYLADYERVKGKVYTVRVSWRRAAAKPEREENVYTLNMADKQGVSQLGDDPLVQVAKHIKRMEEQWKPITSGAKRVKVDAFTSGDRLHERRVADRQRRKWQARSQNPTTDLSD
ncbi:hypothetical protein BSY239_675 [Hydrogenophaga sp. RAC07]|uniref:hypothetical protein n=1 Tax=Hydrogenophaga sp. RAC07 TaxID=1842537 RepID=UPI00083D568E|nr:hypothetical protein [Hydrogenophaga sp. RAC07]AOF84171.1 hypothetical protein BSY239_675 [Hydrogenophaga sp. RAC07]